MNGPQRAHILAKFLLFWKCIINQKQCRNDVKGALLSLLEMGA